MSLYGNRDPDATLVPLFKYLAVKNEALSMQAGRPVFDDWEVVEIHRSGSKDFGVYPALAMAGWVEDPVTRESTMVTYAERFRHQYQQFKAQANQTKSGTPLAHAPFLTEARRAELRAQNVYTVEALAAIDGNELKNLGPFGREMKNNAAAYIEQSRQQVPDLQMQAELEAIKARNQLLEEDVTRLKEAQKLEAGYDGMSNDQLREFITQRSGQAPLGSVQRKTLIRMAQQCDPDAA